MPEFEVYSERVVLPDKTQLRVSILVTECAIKEDGAHLIITPCSTPQELDEKMEAFLEKLERAREAAKSSFIQSGQSDPEQAPEVDLMPLPAGAHASDAGIGGQSELRPEIDLMTLPTGA